MKSKRNKDLEPGEQKWAAIEDFGIGQHEGVLVGLKRIWKDNVDLSRDVRKEILSIRELNHDNLVKFNGMVIDFPYVFVVNELCSRGCLKDVVENDEFQLDDVFLASMAFDIVKGMDYLHKSSVGCHGRLKSSNCLIDARWVVRLSSFGMNTLREGEVPEIEGVQQGKDLLWSAPELLRADMNLSYASPILLQKADSYSFGILLYEIYSRAGPWGDEISEPADIIRRVMYPKDETKPFRPDVKQISDAPPEVKETCEAVWLEKAEDRPSFPFIRKKLRAITKGSRQTVVANMVKTMEKYTEKLEVVIKERTAELETERRKSEKLLEMMLPVSVANSLKKGHAVQAEAFQLVTVYFSDVFGFSEMTLESSPMEVVVFLNDLYTYFDNIIERYDVYKVETIADSYMVVSGLPIPNGPHHAGEIASMSLNLLESVKTFKIRHRPGKTLNLRIGIHSGPCVAGVVGLKMPRYCLFGDTVNTASRMESNGEALKIHCSADLKRVLDQIGGYETKERGMVAMKGKGEQLTYWLTGEDKSARRERILREVGKYPTLKNTVIDDGGMKPDNSG